MTVHSAHCFIRHYREPSLSNAAPIYHYLKPSRKALFKRNQTQSVEEEKTWSQGPGNNGLEAGFTGAGMGGGVNLGGGASAFICITNTHRTQYVQFIIWIYRRFPLNIVFRRMSLLPLTWKDLLQPLHWDCFFFLSHPQCIRSALPPNRPCRDPVRYPPSLSWSYLSLVSGTTVQTKSSRTKKDNLAFPTNFWRSCKTKQDQYFGVKK